jgi:hypothetical protein
MAEVSGQLHAPAALPPGEKPRYPLDRRLGGPHGRGGEEKISQYSKLPTYYIPVRFKYFFEHYFQTCVSRSSFKETYNVSQYKTTDVMEYSVRT